MIRRTRALPNGIMLSLVLAGLVLCCACSTPPTAQERLASAQQLAAARGWAQLHVHAGRFTLAAWATPALRPAPVLTVYIEGDGLAWLSPSRPSADPTPVDPVALKLALAQPAGNVAYLARPCQYQEGGADGCSAALWTGARFSPGIVEAMNGAVDQLKARFGATWLELVGYSGGGAITGLLAARRSDVSRWVTVAGNIDHQAWTRYHRVHALEGSANPADDRAALAHIRQWHFVGRQDTNIPPFIARAFTAGMPDARVIELDGFDHHCCWAQHWPALSAGVVGGGVP